MARKPRPKVDPPIVSLRSRCAGSFEVIRTCLEETGKHMGRKPRYAIRHSLNFLEGLSVLLSDRHLDPLFELIAASSIAGLYIHAAHPRLLGCATLPELILREKKLMATIAALQDLLPDISKQLAIFLEQRKAVLRHYEPDKHLKPLEYPQEELDDMDL